MRRFSFLTLVPVLMLSSCSQQPENAGKIEKPPVPVIVAVAEARDVPVKIQAIGTVQAYSVVSIRSQITGLIQDVHFHEGQEVKEGDPLFTLDPRLWVAALDQAQANLARDEAQLVSSRLSFLRTSNLFQSKIAAQQDYDTAEAGYRAAQATLLADGAAVTNAQVNLGYTEIDSPIEGRAGNFLVKKGNVVKSPDDVLLSVTQVHPIYVAFAVPEQCLPAIRHESQRSTLRVEATFPGETNSAENGELTFIDNSVDTNTGMILLKGTFANTNNVLWPGQYIRAALTLSNLVHATVLPSQAVQAGQQGDYVFVVNADQTVVVRSVTTGISEDGRIVINNGVKPGENVVVDGQSRLAPGAKVDVKTADSAGLTNATALDPP